MRRGAERRELDHLLVPLVRVRLRGVARGQPLAEAPDLLLLGLRLEPECLGEADVDLDAMLSKRL